MVSIDRIENGFKRYVDTHFIPNLPDGGFQKVVVAAGASILASRLKAVLHEWSKKEMLHTLGIVNEHGFDLETIKAEVVKQFGDAGVVLDIPMIGSITFKKEDVDRLYRTITEG